MAIFQCHVTDTKGRTETLTVTASDETEAIRSFSKTGKIVISVLPIAPSQNSLRSGKKNQKTVLEFTEMMELLLDSGLSLKDALEVASSIGLKSEAGSLAIRLLGLLQKGSSFAQSIESSPDVFPVIYRGMIGVGDRIGSVERIFPRLASYLRDQKVLKDKISAALAYPVFVLAVTIFGAAGLSIFVMPKLEAIFTGFGNDASDIIKKNIAHMNIIFGVTFAVLAILVITAIVLKVMGKYQKATSLAIDRIILFLPIIGHFVSSWETLNFAFAMETLASGGVSVEHALQEAASVVSNGAYREALYGVKEEVMKGGSLSAAFSRRKEFPVYLSQWITIGERSGKTERVFSQIRTYFQAEVEQSSAKFMTLIEPTLIVLVGILILGLVMGVVVPLFSMYGSIL